MRMWLGRVTMLWCWCAVLAVAGETPRPHVLILCSYHHGNTWTDGQVAGQLEVFRHGLPQVQLSIEYLDKKRYPEPEIMELERRLLESKYAGRLDLVVVNDNAALELALQLRATWLAGVPIVFAGINGYAEIVDRLPPDVTGVAETVDFAATLQLIPRLLPQTETVAIIVDTTPSGQGTRRDVEAVIADLPASGVTYSFLEYTTLGALAATVQSLPPDTAIMMCYYNRDADGTYYDHEESIDRVVAAAAVPVFHVYGFALDRGIVGGHLLDAVSHGAAAAQLAVRILQGEAVESVARLATSPCPPRFDWQVLARFGIDVSAVPAGSIMINQPAPTLWQLHRGRIIAAIILVSALLLTVGLLAVALWGKRQAEQALRSSEEDLRTTLDSIGDAVIAVDRTGLVRRLNPVAEQLTGWSQAAAVGQPLDAIYRVIDGASHAACENPCTEAMASGMMQRRTGHGVLVARDGSERSVADSAASIRQSDGTQTGAVLVFHDVTDHRRLEERLRDSLKMESVGRLAGGVAHDFNNMLSGIMGAAELLQERLREQLPEQVRLATTILQAGERAADLTHKLLAFSRKAPGCREVLDLHEVVESTVDLLRHAVDRRITIAVALEAKSRSVLGDRTQLQQAIMNLGVNARDAMSEGGTISLKTSCTTITEQDLVAQEFHLEPGHYLRLTVSDDGTGIDPTVLPHIFEPFFTTKEVGAGTGLGLAAVYGTACDHGGAITVGSQAGAGTAFHLLLPLVEGVHAERDCTPLSTRTVRPRTILVIDDEEVIRATVAESLTRLGYTVETAVDGAEGLALFQARPHQYDCVLLDMVMPQMSGPDCFRALRRIRPDLPVVVASGFADAEAVQTLCQEGLAGFVAKPFRQNTLATAIHEAIVGRRASQGE